MCVCVCVCVCVVCLQRKEPNVLLAVLDFIVQLLWTYQTEPVDKGEEHFTRLLEHFREFGGDRRLSALQVHYR